MDTDGQSLTEHVYVLLIKDILLLHTHFLISLSLCVLCVCVYVPLQRYHKETYKIEWCYMISSLMYYTYKRRYKIIIYITDKLIL